MNKTLLIFVSHVSFFMSHRFEIALAAKKLGYKVKVAFGEIDADIKYLSEKGIESIHVPIQRGGINPFSEARSLLSLWSLFRKLKPDIVHLVTIKPYLYGGIIARLTKVPCLVSAISGLGTLFIQNDFKSRFLRFMLYQIYKFAFGHHNQKVIFQNQHDAKVLIKWGVLNQEKVLLIRGSGVNLDNFTHLDEPNDIVTVCFAGRLLREKGVYEYVSAARLLNQRKIKANFLLVGDIDSKNPSALKEEELEKIRDEGIVQILGYQKNIAKIYSGSHIVCLPSYREGLPKSLMEAAAASRAVVTTDVPGCKDAIIPNKSGLLVPVKDSKKLANTLQLLIENNKLRISMGKVGRQLAEEEFVIEKIVKKHMDIYKLLSQ
jgi:glycosyltransferase involved in cell wall biosynthesis